MSAPVRGTAPRMALPERGRPPLRQVACGARLPPDPQARRPAALPPLRPPPHLREPAPRRRRPDHLRERPARPRQSRDHAPVLRAVDSRTGPPLGRYPRSQPSVGDSRTRNGTKVEPKRGVAGVGDPEVRANVGSPGWARTSDFLINSRGPAHRRPSSLFSYLRLTARYGNAFAPAS